MGLSSVRVFPIAHPLEWPRRGTFLATYQDDVACRRGVDLSQASKTAPSLLDFTLSFLLSLSHSPRGRPPSFSSRPIPFVLHLPALSHPSSLIPSISLPELSGTIPSRLALLPLSVSSSCQGITPHSPPATLLSSSPFQFIIFNHFTPSCSLLLILSYPASPKEPLPLAFPLSEVILPSPLTSTFFPLLSTSRFGFMSSVIFSQLHFAFPLSANQTVHFNPYVLNHHRHLLCFLSPLVSFPLALLCLITPCSREGCGCVFHWCA